ncbi:hypothetical protein B0H14DRAFT_3711048 [Mycena olivaceomarginata]|nr:hypothetical protein B0H14DRAFT_3711048 [Mycena olivaceomarginata]
MQPHPVDIDLTSPDHPTAPDVEVTSIGNSVDKIIELDLDAMEIDMAAPLCPTFLATQTRTQTTPAPTRTRARAAHRDHDRQLVVDRSRSLRQRPQALPPRVVISISGEPTPQEGSIEWTGSSGKSFDMSDPPTGTTYTGRCVGKQLFISDVDEKKKVEALVKITAPATDDEPERVIGTFPSRLATRQLVSAR